MGIIAVVSNPSDGSTESIIPDQTAARTGSGLMTDEWLDPLSSPELRTGTYIDGTNTRVFEAWVQFMKEDLLLPPGVAVVDVQLRVVRGRDSYEFNHWPYSYIEDDSTWVLVRDWTAPLASQWVNLNATYGAGIEPDAQFLQLMQDRSSGPPTGAGEGAGNFYEIGGRLFKDAIKPKLIANTDVGLVLFQYSSQFTYPQVGTWLQYFAANSGQVVQVHKPTLRVHTLKTHDLNYVLGGSVQMTDGTAVFLRYDRPTNKVGLYYQKVSQVSPTLIGWLDTTSASTEYFDLTNVSAQAISLCTDLSNNIYVVGTSGNPSSWRKITITGYKYNGAFSWTKQTSKVTDQDPQTNVGWYHAGRINNVAPVWLPNPSGPVGGQLAIMHSKGTGQKTYEEMGSHVLNAGWVFGTSGIAKNDFLWYIPPMVLPDTRWMPFNAVGTGLDALPVGSAGKIVTDSFCQPPRKSTKTRAGVHTATIPANNNGGSAIFVPASLMDQEADADAKLRTVWMSSSLHYATYHGSRFEIRVIADDSLYRSFDCTALGLINFPSKAQMEADGIWDIVFDSALNSFWIYYVDSQNPRHIRKVRYDWGANLIYNSFQITASPQGPSGGRIWALRAPRGKVDVRCVLLDVATQAADGTPQTLITLRDLTANAAPAEPVLDPIVSFNATAVKTFDYTFVDLNVGDWETSHEIEIKRVSTGLTVHSSGKIASTLVGTKYRHTLAANVLSNDTQYQIRIRSYDSVDVVGAWSAWTSFSTTGTGGTVTIITPQEDNEPLPASHVVVSWSYSNVTPSVVQTGYQVRVYNHLTNALVSDSGIVASTATTRDVTGLSTDIQYRIEVQVRDSNSALSGAGIRLVFPDFDNPSTPMIDVIRGDGYVEIRVTNPPPLGENPVTVTNQIARKLETEADTAYKVIGTCPVNGLYRDYAVASAKNYCYKARGSST